jgi:hypothetical protein
VVIVWVVRSLGFSAAGISALAQQMMAAGKLSAGILGSFNGIRSVFLFHAGADTSYVGGVASVEQSDAY